MSSAYNQTKPFASVTLLSDDPDALRKLVDIGKNNDYALNIKSVTRNQPQELLFDKNIKKVTKKNGDWVSFANRPLPERYNQVLEHNIAEFQKKPQGGVPVVFHYESKVHGMALLKHMYDFLGGWHKHIPHWVEGFYGQEFDGFLNKVRAVSKNQNDIVEWSEL